MDPQTPQQPTPQPTVDTTHTPPPSPQQPVQQPSAHYAPPSVSPSPKNPGQVLGVIGIILPFLLLAPIGLVLSIVSVVKSKKAAASPVLGIVGIVLNVIGLISVGILVAITLTAYSGIQQRANDSHAQIRAVYVEKKAEAYNVQFSSYPQTIEDFNKTVESSIDDSTVHFVNQAPTDSSSIWYAPCGQTGAQITYLTQRNGVQTTYLGDGDTTCQ